MNTFSKLMLSPINHLKANIINKQQLVSIWILIKKTKKFKVIQNHIKRQKQHYILYLTNCDRPYPYEFM